MRSWVACLGLSLVMVLSACKEESGGGGSGGGSGGGGSGDTSCDGVCDSLMSQHCFYTGGDADCRMSCNGWETQYVAKGADYCKKAWDDYKSCIASETLECPDGNTDARWGVVACREHWDHFNNYCINMNATPSTACMAVPTFDMICDGAHPHAQSCFGDVPSGCIVGGTESYSNLYCCP